MENSMRRAVLMGILLVVAGCQNTRSPVDNRLMNAADPGIDPLLTIDEQQSRGRSRYSYPDENRFIAPLGHASSGSPSGR